MKRSTGLLLTAGLAVLAALLLLLFVLRLTRSPDARSTLGDDVFKIRNAGREAVEIRSHGPLLFQDPLSKGRNIFLNHTGVDPRTGWSAFEARRPDDPRCMVAIDRSTTVLRDCHGAVIPPDGGDLRHYPTRVQDNTVLVNLHP